MQLKKASSLLSKLKKPCAFQKFDCIKKYIYSKNSRAESRKIVTNKMFLEFIFSYEYEFS